MSCWAVQLHATNLLVDKTSLFGLLFRFPIGVLGKIQLLILSLLIVKGQTCAVAVAVDDIVVVYTIGQGGGCVHKYYGAGSGPLPS